MELLNATKMVAGYTQGIDKDAREYLIVAVKGTFLIPAKGYAPTLAPDQVPLTDVDDYSGEPGFSATLHECDFAPEKKYCDVIVNGSAYAPHGKPARSVRVGLKMPGINKSFNVIGDRFWIAGPTGIGKTFPKPFITKAVSYDNAFGGVDNFHPDENKRDAYLANPVGQGFHRFLDRKLIHDTPLPNTESLAESVNDPQFDYMPMSFGCIGRSWPGRVCFAGTYDQHWIDNVFPFLPADFDSRYYQSAPHDQQCPYLQGGERVQLMNMTATGMVEFAIPDIKVPVVFFKNRELDKHTQAVADTLVLEPDKGLFTITWRVSEPLQKNMFEIAQVLVGSKSNAWWGARRRGKTYHRSLASVVQSSGLKS